MKIVFTGLETPLEVDSEWISVLEVHNRTLFARICQSLASLTGSQACEPYYVWDDAGSAIQPKNAYLYVGDPFSLPWQERDLAGALQQHFESCLIEDYMLRDEIESLGRAISSRIALLGLQMSADYSFGAEWDLRRYLKAFDFDVCRGDVSLLENLIEFFKFASDMRFSRMLVFVNLKSFLSGNQLDLLYEQAVFSRVRLLLLENVKDERLFPQEKKKVVDQCFIES